MSAAPPAALSMPAQPSPTRLTTQLDFEVPVREDGDVNARVWIRIREVEQSLALIEQILDQLPARRAARASSASRAAVAKVSAMVEAFRGDILVWVRLDADGKSSAATCAIRPGSNGRCWKRRSKATSSPTSRSATNPSTAPIRDTISEAPPCADSVRKSICATPVTEPPPAADDAALAELAASARPRRAQQARPQPRRSARSTPAPATAASSRSTRSTTPSTISSASACASSPRHATPTCCW